MKPSKVCISKWNEISFSFEKEINFFSKRTKFFLISKKWSIELKNETMKRVMKWCESKIWKNVDAIKGFYFNIFSGECIWKRNLKFFQSDISFSVQTNGFEEKRLSNGKKLYKNESKIEKKWKIENRKIITSNRKLKNQG